MSQKARVSTKGKGNPDTEYIKIAEKLIASDWDYVFKKLDASSKKKLYAILDEKKSTLKKTDNPPNLALSRMSKKRKLRDVSADDTDEPSRKRIKLDDPLNQMKVSDLKKEIKKRDTKQKISGLKKAELKSILFKQTQLSPSAIDKLNRSEIICELKTHNEYKGRSSWKRKDLCQYLKYINSDPNSLDHKYIQNEIAKSDYDRKKEISKNKFIKLPLFKIHNIYEFESKQTDRDAMYKKLQRSWKCNQRWEEKKNKLLQPVINHFFNKKNNILTIKKTFKKNDKVLIVRNLSSSERMKIHNFAEENGLYSESVGADPHRIIHIARKCDKSEVLTVLDTERKKIFAALEKEQKLQNESEWNETMQKHLALKESLQSNSNSHQKQAMDFCGEWAMNQDFGWGSEDNYLYINESEGVFYGSFLIGPIEGKLRLDKSKKNKYSFDWRGREIGERVIQTGDKHGSITFAEFGTEAIGVLNSDYGNFEFTAFRISSDVDKIATNDDFDYDEEEQYERERRSRWN